MRTKVTVAAFIIVISVAAIILIVRNCLNLETQSAEAATPSVATSGSVGAPLSSSAGGEYSSGDFPLEEGTQVSFVNLSGDETLVSSFTADLDGDTYEDQVSVIRTISSPYLSILIALYNPARNEYERKTVIKTQVSQAQSFSCTALDLIGDHSTSLVYQGFNPEGEGVLEAYLILNDRDGFSLKNIASLSGDGAVFVETRDRSDAYERLHANGESFSIEVYTSDSSAPDSPDQIQNRYDWDDDVQRYTLSRTVRVAGDRLVSEELSKMQSGGLESVTAALNGLWHMTSTDGAGTGKSMSFDYGAKEVIFFNGDNEEVYEWTHSNLRHNGVYISATNQEIQSLRRRIDVTFLSVREMSIHIQEDVTSIVSESATWNGTYQKSSTPYPVYQNKNASAREVQSLLSNDTGWETSENYTLKFDGMTYSIIQDASSSGIKTGTCAFYSTGAGENGEVYVQFDMPLPSRTSALYRVTRGEGGEDEVGMRFILEECTSQASGVVLEDRSPVVLTASREDPEA